MPDHIRPGSWDGFPVFWTPSESWALIMGVWTEVNAAEVSREGLVLSPDRFGRLFGEVPPLPKTAFDPAERLAVLERKLKDARQEVRDLQVMQMRPGQSANKLKFLAELERSARAEVKLRLKTLQYARNRIA
jgi:hypothetical protein